MMQFFLVPALILFLLHQSSILILVTAAAVHDIKTDQSVLLTLKDHITHDPNNTIPQNWSMSTSVCNWVGITCGVRHLRVTALNLSYMGLVGTIPPHIGNLSFLAYLNLANNSFHGSLPNELSRLHRLQIISLRHNNFAGEVPPFFNNSSSLKLVDLRNNQLSGLLPSNVFNVPSLLAVDFSFNQFSGSVPSTIANFSLLKLINLSKNNLSGQIPENIFDHLPKLEEFYLPYNQFYGEIPSSLFNCKQLQTLSMSFNKFTGTIPAEIGNSTLLLEIYLSYNNLQGTIPDEIGKLSNLEVLSLHFNNLTGEIPSTIFNISKVEEISLTTNQLTGSLTPSLGLAVPNLKWLYLDSNYLSGPIPRSISNATKLIDLDLIYNSFSGYIPGTLGDLRNLRWLNLGVNNLTFESSSHAMRTLVSLANCKYLQKIDLSENPLNFVLPTSIGNFSGSLNDFGLESCNIKGSIPEDIGNISGLIYLGLSDNEITGTIPAQIGSLRGIQTLVLENNELQGYIPQEICQIHGLWALSLSGNKFYGPVPTCFGNLESLRLLSLSSNRLNSTLPSTFWGLRDILFLNLSSNNLTGSLPLSIGNLKVVTELYLSDNQLSGDIPSGIGSLQNLVNLSLARNGFEGPIPQSIGGMVSLESLDLSENNLSGVIPKSLEALVYLKRFNVSFNKLQGEIPDGGPFKNFIGDSFMKNKALCGATRFQVLPCRTEAFGKPRKTTNFRLKYILPVVLATVAAILILVFTYVLVKHRKKNKKLPSEENIPSLATWRRISYHELSRATDGFNEINLLGAGSFGKVYKGTLTDGVEVAIKVFNLQLEEAFKSFDTECEILSNIRHRNLVKIISSCSNTDFKALVLSYMPNGNLEKWLYSHNYFLSIVQRLNIMIDVAASLDYLHGHSTPIVHCDLKPSNVLLDEDMVGHVTDFGIAKLLGEGDTVTSTMTLATIGYMAPEYGLEGTVSRHGDVYSYGILLMETFTGHKPTDEMFLGELSLKQWVQRSFPHAILEIVDDNLLREEKEHCDINKDCLSSIIGLSLHCSAEAPQDRTNMKDVLVALNKIKRKFMNEDVRIK
ncbi:Receptor-like protein kinase [Quillaja saponaria]|uniref:non-specific serine/threonine protein kinase n=1 Tax=Quillaja saponaria TaxID=32244 RepID=A0AAD7M4V4_QUISA|nr:Receptor-like protein kinase [Quillaja saponaria]